MSLRDRTLFGEVLRRLRLEAGLSQEVLAERARVSKQAVSALERGVRRAPQSQTLTLLIDALELDAAGRADLEAASRASAPARVRRTFSPARANTHHGTLLPTIPTSFVGRANDCTSVAALLQSGWCLTIWGSGGIGKTRLAIEVARSVAHHFPDGVWLVELADVVDDGDVARTIATTAGVAQAAEQSVEDAIVGAFRERRALLMLDNAEHVIAASARILERLVRDVPALTIVCTSREPLRIAGERVYRLNALPIPQLDDPALARSPAVQLFVDRAASVGSRVDATSELRTVATICEQLDAIPLALELAAARAPMMTPAEIARDLAVEHPDRLRLLTVGERTADSRHQTLSGVLDWSVALLNETERTALARLSVWPGRWTLDDAVAVICDASIDRWAAIDAVSGLVQRSLVVADGIVGESRAYRMLRTTRTYALRRVELSGDLPRTQLLGARRVRDHLVSENARRNASDHPSNVELSAVRATLRWAILLGNAVELGAEIAVAAERLWGDHGAQHEGIGWLRDARDRLPDGSATLVQTLISIAWLSRALMQYTQAEEAGSRALAIADEGSDPLLRAEARMCLGLSVFVADDRVRGRRLLEEALSLFDQVGATIKSLKVTHELCGIAMLEGHFADARAYALPLPSGFRAFGLQVWAAASACNLAEIEFGLGDTAEAIRRGTSALRALRALNDAVNVAIATHNLAGYSLAAGQIENAVGFVRESLEIAIKHGWEAHVGNAIAQTTAILATTGDVHDAALLTGFLDQRIRVTGVDHRMEGERERDQRVREQLVAAFTPAELASVLRDGADLDTEAAASLALDALDAIASGDAVTLSASVASPSR
jgi:predicted ATPase/transcriptional regulator with XRE-family HTH domain